MRRESLNGHELHVSQRLARARWDEDDDLVAQDVGDEPYETFGLIFGIIVVLGLIVIGLVAMAIWGVASVLF